MITMAHDDWYTFFTTTRLVFFLAGMAIATFWHWWKVSRKNHDIIDWSPVFIVAGLVTIVFVSIQQVALSEEVKYCQEQLQEAVIENSHYDDKLDALTQELIDANSAFFKNLGHPPEYLQNIPDQSLSKKVWVETLLHTYLDRIKEIENRREQLIKDREKNPLPVPNCSDIRSR